MAPHSSLSYCSVCAGPLELEDCVTDENGQAVHELCYVANLEGFTALFHDKFESSNKKVTKAVERALERKYPKAG